MSFVQKFGLSVIDDNIVNDGERVSYLIRFSSQTKMNYRIVM